jgi:hypothetical protein
MSDEIMRALDAAGFKAKSIVFRQVVSHECEMEAETAFGVYRIDDGYWQAPGDIRWRKGDVAEASQDYFARVASLLEHTPPR